MLINMTIFKYLEYSCIRICNIDDDKVINWMCIFSKLTVQHKSNKQRSKTINQIHTAQRRKIKTNKVVQRWWNHKNKRNKIEKNVEFTYSTKKSNLKVWFWIKI